MAIYGLANQDIHHVHERLKYLVPEAKFQLAKKHLKIKNKTKVIFCVKVEGLMQIRHEILDKPVHVIVFDCAYFLENVEGLKVLDIKKTDGVKYQFKDVDDQTLLEALTSKDFSNMTRKKTMDVFALLESRITPSCLNAILTFLYSVQNKEKRALARTTIFNWFFTKRTPKKLESDLLEIFSNKRSTPLEALLPKIQDQQFVKLKEASADIAPLVKAGLSVNYELIGKKFQVAPFDLRYLMQYKYGSADATKAKTKKVRHKAVSLKTSK